MFANNEINHVRPILYYDDINPHSRAVLMILNMLDVDIELRAVEMAKGEHLKPTYAKINPARTVPTMVHKDIIVTDNAIFAYVCENHDKDKAKQLIAFKCYKRHCRVFSRLFFESQVLHRIHGQLMTDLVRKTIYETDVDYHQKKVEDAYDVMESYLKDGAYMAGSVLTAADISFVACLGALDMMFPIDVDRKRWEKLNNWFRRMRSLPVHKINTNGIEKQRRFVEYFAKFRFAGDVRRYTTSVRDSLVPQFTATHARCSIGVQTNTAQQTDFFDQFSADDILQPNRVLENSANDLEDEIVAQTAAIDLLKEIPAVEVTALSLEKDDTQSAATQSPAQLNNPHHEKMPDDRIVPEPVTILAALSEMSTVAERSFGGEQKEKPPVPPRGKRNKTIVMTALAVKGENSENEPIEDSRGVIKEKSPMATSENQKNRDTLKSKNNNMSRLNGGVEPIVPPEPSVSACRLRAVRNIAETTVELRKSSLPIPPKPLTTGNDTLTTSSEPEPNANDKNKPTKIPILPPGSPINGQQVALQYTRGSNAPAAPPLAAPPPTPNNSSQDEQNDFEFPPPPSEVLLQNSRACSKAIRVTKLFVTNKVNAESMRRTVVKKSSGFVRTDNAKVSTDSVTKTAAKKPNDVKLLAETKKLKLVKKTRPAILRASGTKSPSSNISIASLGKVKAAKLQKPSKEANTMQKLITAATSRPVTKSQEKKIQKHETGSGVKVVESSASTVNDSRRVKGGTLNSTEGVKINSKPTEKKRRVEGGGQWRSKEKILVPAVDMHSKLLNADLKEPKTIKAKPAGLVQKQELQKTKISEASSTPPNTTTAGGKAKAVKKELKSANPALSSKNLVKVYPTKIPEDNKTKTTKNFKTSPFVVGVTSLNKSQPNVDTVKRAVIKIKKNRRTKVVSGEVQSVAQSLPFETPCASITELKCVVVQNRIQQKASSATITPDHSTPETTTGKTSQAPAVPAANRILQSPNETGDILKTNPFPIAGKREEVTCSAFKDVPAAVGLVAKAMQTIAAATPNFRAPAISILKVLPPKPPALPPPPLPFHHKLPPPPPPAPPSPPILSPNDAMPQAGTVAKALQFLSAVTSEANPLCSAVKPFRKAALKIKSMEQPASAVVNNAAPNEKMPPFVEDAVDARPLAEILTATVEHMNKSKVEHTNEVKTTNETEQSCAKLKNLSDKTVGNMAQAAGEEAVATNLNQMTDTVVLDCQITPLFALNEVNKSEDGVLVNIKEDEVLNTAADLIEATLEAPKEDPKTLDSEAHEAKNSSPSSAVCTNIATVFTESAARPTQSAQNIIKAPHTDRHIIERALINENIVVIEPTPLPALPNIIITEYTRTEPLTVNSLLSGDAGPAPGNTIAPALRGHSAGPCSLGSSANVVISTLGYTPMSDLEPTPEQLLPPIRPKYINTTPPLPSLPATINATAISEKTEEQLTGGEAVMPARALSPRMREEKPYPTAHRSRSQQVGDRKIIIRGRVK